MIASLRAIVRVLTWTVLCTVLVCVVYASMDELYGRLWNLRRANERHKENEIAYWTNAHFAGQTRERAHPSVRGKPNLCAWPIAALASDGLLLIVVCGGASLGAALCHVATTKKFDLAGAFPGLTIGGLGYVASQAALSALGASWSSDVSESFPRIVLGSAIVAGAAGSVAFQRIGNWVRLSQLEDLSGMKLTSGRVFLCHANDDQAKVKELYERLKAKNFYPWLDKVDLLPGADWRKEIEHAVQDAWAVVVCLSKTTESKVGFVQEEIRIALEAARKQPLGAVFLVPCLLEPCEVPDALADRQYVRLYETDGETRLFEALHGVFSRKSKSA